MMIDNLTAAASGLGEPKRKTIQQDIEEAFQAHGAEIQNYLASRTHDAFAAEDLAQDVFLHFSTYEHPILDVRGFLFRTARNLLSNWVRDRKQNKTVPIMSAIRDSSGIRRAPGNEPLDTRESGPDDEASQHEQALLVLASPKSACVLPSRRSRIHLPGGKQPQGSKPPARPKPHSR